MVLSGLRTKSRTVNADYLIYIQEIKPWPPTQTLKTLRSVLIQWENGDRNSGTTTPVVPSLGSTPGEGKIEFKESFKLPVTFSMKNGGEVDTFQKNCLEFSLYEPRKDKTVKGQLLGTAIIDLADYAAIKETSSISVAVKCQRSFRNTVQPILYLKIQKVGKRRTRSISMDSLALEASMAKNGGESVSALMNGEYAEEAEFASITDDDASSSHSSLNVSSSASISNGSSPPQNGKNSSDNAKDYTVEDIKDYTARSKTGFEKSEKMSPSTQLKIPQGNFSCSSSIDLSSCPGSPVNDHGSLSKFTEPSIMTTPAKDIITPGVQSYPTFAADVYLEEICTSSPNGDSLVDIQIGSLEEKKGDKELENVIENHIVNAKNLTFINSPENRFSQDTTTKKISSKIATLSNPYSAGTIRTRNNILTSERLKHVKSVRSLLDSGKSNGSVGDGQNVSRVLSSEREDSKIYSKEMKNDHLDSKVQHLEHRIKALEGELREAAAVEVAIYSVVAEHGSSMSKVHAPARRLSRLYLHACKEKSLSRRANAAKTSVSGLLMVSKACGNDVPRLTFWLSNAVLLRIIISQATGDSKLPLSSGPSIEKAGNGKSINNKPSTLKWESSSSMNGSINGLCADNEWEDPNIFTSALEKIEAWIFSRIVESVWWQTLTPLMQSTSAKAIEGGVGSNSSKSYKRVSSSCDQERINLSLDLWKKAFQNASERLCPVRAGGHGCGCLHVITKLIMEQCVARLDVAMFNAILRESDDEIPTDPVSDPISDPKVLPIPAGTFSFGAGARLKNAIGNWSRLLSDLFGMDDDPPLEHEADQNHDGERQDPSFKSFHILNALSDLMMLPKDMLLSSSIRKEVCPTFGGSLIKRIIVNFVPDEFCPDPIPKLVLEALDSEENLNLESNDFVTNFPCTAAPIIYSPPQAASIKHIIGEIKSPQLRRSGSSSVLRKSHTSDDELDDLDSPLSCIFMDNLLKSSSSNPSKSNILSKQNGSLSSVRYQLLREVWKDSV